MPSEEMRMRPVCRTQRQRSAAALIDEGLYASDIVDLPRDKDIEIVRQADQAAIEHPVWRTGQCDAIAKVIGAVVLHRPDVGSVDLGTPTTIDDLQTGDRAALVIGAEHDTPEYSVAHQGARQLLETLPLRLDGVGRLVVSEMQRGFAGLDARQHRFILVEPSFDDTQ